MHLLFSQHSPVEQCVFELHGVPVHLSKHFLPKEPQQYPPAMHSYCDLHDFPRQFSLHSPTAFLPRSQQDNPGEQSVPVAHDFPRQAISQIPRRSVPRSQQCSPKGQSKSLKHLFLLQFKAHLPLQHCWLGPHWEVLSHDIPIQLDLVHLPPEVS